MSKIGVKSFNGRGKFVTPIRCFSEVNEDLLGILVECSHAAYLLVLLNAVFLVDADAISPQDTRLVNKTESNKDGMKVGREEKHFVLYVNGMCQGGIVPCI